MEFIKKLFLYFSSFVPLYFLVITKLIVEIINGNLHFNVLNTSLLILMTLMISLGIYGLAINVFHNHTPSIEIEILSSQNITDQHFLGYFSLFVLFALTFELEKVSMFCVFVIILIFIGIVYIKNNLFYINPLLNILGYNFYNVTYKVKGEKFSRQAKIFYRGNFTNKKNTYYAKLNNESFSYIVKK